LTRFPRKPAFGEALGRPWEPGIGPFSPVFPKPRKVVKSGTFGSPRKPPFFMKKWVLLTVFPPETPVWRPWGGLLGGCSPACRGLKPPVWGTFGGVSGSLDSHILGTFFDKKSPGIAWGGAGQPQSKPFLPNSPRKKYFSKPINIFIKMRHFWHFWNKTGAWEAQNEAWEACFPGLEGLFSPPGGPKSLD
jgi:hypothetical protein